MNDEERPRDFAEAFLRNKEMEETRAYLSAGRRFKDTPEDIVKQDWVAAYRRLIDGERSLVRDLDDLGAELRLRGIEAPSHLVQTEAAEAVRRLQREGQIDKEAVKQEIRKFQEDLDKPPN